MALEIPIEKITDGLSPIIQHIPTVCELKGYDLFAYIILPILVGLFLLLLIKLHDTLKIRFFRVFSTRGYIRVLMLKQNKRMISRIVKLDKFNNFMFPRIGDRKYSLEKMYDFVLAYDRYGFPIFLYDVNFILPLKIDNKMMRNEIREQLNITDEKKISAISMKLDSSIYYTVYDKKLISDLYSITGSEKARQIMIWAVIIIVGLVVLYYTGILEQLLSIVGVDISTATNSTVRK